MGGFSRAGVMNRFGTSYKRGTLFFPKALRKKVYIVYAFVRAADQLVDDPSGSRDQAAKDLQAMYDRRRAAWQGTPSNDPLIDAFVTVAKEAAFDPVWIDAFFDAMRMDTHVSKYTTYEQLTTYMYGSAEVVGLMMTQLIGYTGERDLVFAYAQQLGEAMQYTNFLRDIVEDYQSFGRIYIPADRLQRAGLSHDDLVGYIKQGFADTHRTQRCEQEIQITQDLYKQALHGVMLLDRQGRFAVWVASMLYAGILWKIEKKSYDPFAHDVHTTKREKLRIFLGAVKTYYW